MELSIPVNWQHDLLSGLNISNTAELYGKLKEDEVGGGRPAALLPYIRKSEAKKYISDVRRRGLKFNYLLNSLCLGNKEWTSNGQRNIRRLLDWLLECEVDAVTVSTPYLLQLIKKCYPYFEVQVSVIADVDSPRKAKFWEELGADQITLSLTTLNRNFELLRQIRTDVSCRLQIIGNSLCLHDYPFCTPHYIENSHSSQTGWKREGRGSYFYTLCGYFSMLENYRIISSGWIRPEDLYYYEELGINRIKLVERTMKTEFILRIAEAYTQRKYVGNLMDLIGWNINRMVVSPGILSTIRSKLRKFMGKIKLPVRLPGMHNEEDLSDYEIYLDNQKLEGFLKFFVEGRCKSYNCNQCAYCKEIATKTLYIPDTLREKIVTKHLRCLDDIILGKPFHVKNYCRKTDY